MPPVRLDPWQNIVGVNWGAPDNLPPAGDLISPVLWDWEHRHTITGFDRSDITMKPNVDTGGFFENPEVGDLLLAHISADIAAGTPHPQVTISGPSAAWKELWQFSTESPTEGVGFEQTGSLWYHFIQVGDPTEYTWTYSPDCPVIGGIYRVIDNFPDASPFPDALETDIKLTTGVVIAPDFTISRDKELLLAFIDRASRFNTSGIFPSNPSGSGSYTRRTFHDSFGSANGHSQIVYDAEDEPGPGAIGQRTLSISTSFHTIMGHLAILGNPAP